MLASKLFPILLLSILQHCGIASSAKILFYAAIGSHSTRISKWPLMEALADKGHEVTYLSAFKNFELDPNKSKIKTYEPKKWADSMGSWEEIMSFYQMRKNGQAASAWYDLRHTARLSCEVLYSDPEFVKWVKSSKFDLVVIEASMNECAYGMVHLWGAKFALFETMTVTPWLPDAYGLPDDSSSITDIAFGFEAGHQMSFWQRFVNAWNPIWFALMREWTYFPALEETTRQALGEEGENIPSFKEIEKNASLLFITTHFSMDYPRSFPPHVVPVGGMVVAKKQKPMPAEMESFIKDSPSGFVYISFGTVTEFTTYDTAVQIEFINALRQFPDVRFVWKSSNPINVTSNMPENVLVAKWVPQQTLLAHPKILAFITHSGMGSTMEAIHFSVPVVCLPILADQDYNAEVTVKRGAGLKVEIIGMKEAQLANALKEVLYNKKYRLAMNKLTKIFKDRRSPPIENAVWWLEYLLRHDNIQEYIVPTSVHQPWWKRRQIDVWVVSAIIAALIVIIPLVLLFLVIKELVTFVLGKEKVSKKGKVKTK